MDTPTIQRYRDIDDHWRWRLLGADGHPLADGELAFPDETSLERHLERVRTNLPAATIADDVDDCQDTTACVVRTRGHDDEWRWELHIDGECIAESGEGYADRDALEAAIERTTTAMAEAAVSTWGT